MVVVRPIEYKDNWKVARDKINEIMQAVIDSIPSIWENGHWYIWDVDTWITARGVELRENDNLIKQEVNGDTYVDLQLESDITPTSLFPIWVCVGNVKQSDWWEESWILLNMKTLNWDYARMLYWDSWKLYFDNGSWVLKRIATTEYVDNALSSLRDDLHIVAYTGKSSDLDNDAWFTADNVLTATEYEDLWPVVDSDDKRYFIYKTVKK